MNTVTFWVGGGLEGKLLQGNRDPLINSSPWEEAANGYGSPQTSSHDFLVIQQFQIHLSKTDQYSIAF